VITDSVQVTRKWPWQGLVGTAMRRSTVMYGQVVAEVEHAGGIGTEESLCR
jgi:hypothetical protein